MPTDPTVETLDDGVARVRWTGAGADAVRAAVDEALVSHGRVEAHVAADDTAGQRTATWSGLRKEGVRRGVAGDHVVYARLRSDAPVGEPDGFRALLNSFLPRKRGIGQMLIRDDRGRVLLCRLTYKRDWDLPGGVVEVGESPRVAVGREVLEELALQIDPGPLLLTDWLPPWGGWDDALCLVFDGGTHTPALLDRVVRQEREIRDVEFCDPDQVEERCADFTARRVRAALAALDGGTTYTESGRV
ncbi:NUDIX hydrolase [uncultured Nocardioides sp.]|uniref:NUDIX hydrolase n=1 Tax=uncultured Nocardioides sp. TaxID=198441 RepID=UPI0026125F0C|nr:NUDIX hydrolase [uncultured Nocardioides sp.]